MNTGYNVYRSIMEDQGKSVPQTTSISNETICLVKNRSAGKVLYNLKEEGIRREFMPGETKRIPFWELKKLSYQDGGMALLNQFLQLIDVEAIEELDMYVEPEYSMNEQEIVDVIANGSLDKFLDVLDYAPRGAQDLIKRIAVDLPMTDTTKIEALKEKTGFDVSKALANKRAEEMENEKDGISTVQERRRRVPVDRAIPTRREETAEEVKKSKLPSYNIVN